MQERTIDIQSYFMGGIRGPNDSGLQAVRDASGATITVEEAIPIGCLKISGNLQC